VRTTAVSAVRFARDRVSALKLSESVHDPLPGGSSFVPPCRIRHGLLGSRQLGEQVPIAQRWQIGHASAIVDRQSRRHRPGVVDPVCPGDADAR
jgi:hypothetical protein